MKPLRSRWHRIIYLGDMMYTRECCHIDRVYVIAWVSNYHSYNSNVHASMHWCIDARHACRMDWFPCAFNIFCQLYPDSIYSFFFFFGTPERNPATTPNHRLHVPSTFRWWPQFHLTWTPQETSEKSFELRKASLASECNGPKDRAILCRCQLFPFVLFMVRLVFTFTAPSRAHSVEYHFIVFHRISLYLTSKLCL